MFYVMFPSDGHKAACHHEFQKHYRKVVVKIPIVHQRKRLTQRAAIGLRLFLNRIWHGRMSSQGHAV